MENRLMSMMQETRLARVNRSLNTALVAGLSLICCSALWARPWRPAQLPNGTVIDGRGCVNCHVDPSGGGMRNDFGESVRARLIQLHGSASSGNAFWDVVLAEIDSDGDGYTNGEELGDPNGDLATVDLPVRNPGQASSVPPSPQPVVTGAPAVPGADFTVSWQGGRGPYLVEQKGSLLDTIWRPALATSTTSSTLPRAARVAWHRVSDLGQGPPVAMTAVLAPDFVGSPPPESSASGSANFVLRNRTLHFEIHYRGLTGPATIAHIHGPAPAGQPAGILVNLAPYSVGSFGTSGVIKGSVDLTAARKAQVLAGLTYVNIHTSANSGGEIRGQIVPVHFAAALHGAATRPNPVQTAGSGSGIFSLVGDQLTLHVLYEGLSGPATGAHIHGPADPETPAGVLVNLQPLNGGAFGVSGALAGTVTLAPAQLSALVSGLTYVNIHTDAHSGGEIRGQIVPQLMGVGLTAALSGAAEKPTSVVTDATGFGHMTVVGDVLQFAIQYRGLSGVATAAHIHGPASSSEPAGPLINLAPYNGGAFGSSGSLVGAVVLTAEQKAAVLEGRSYVNVHTPNNSGGEIRGQLTPAHLVSFLNGAAERPNPVVTPATGLGILSAIGDQLTFHILYSGLSGTATAAHIHGPADVTVPAGPLINLGPFNGGTFGSSGALTGATSMSTTTLGAVADGLTYVNVHTEANSGGEIRGQILRP